MYDRIEKLIFEDRSTDHDQKSIFDRNHYRQSGTQQQKPINLKSFFSTDGKLIAIYHNKR